MFELCPEPPLVLLVRMLWVVTSVRFASETVSLDKPRFVETISQSSMNVVVADKTVVERVHVSPYKVVCSDTLSSPTKVVVSPLIVPQKKPYLSLMSYWMLKHPRTNQLVWLKPILRSPLR
jgi:hypothetical protein